MDAKYDPPRMTVKWLMRQTDEDLQVLCEHWEHWCCRGHMIRKEIERRADKKTMDEEG